jgi:predicted RNase H-like HicB family nuclease
MRRQLPLERDQAYARLVKVSAVLTQSGGLWLAECEEVDRIGEGSTPDEAVASLREALRDYFDVEAVAPPSQPAHESIEIVLVDAPTSVPLRR